MRAANLSVMAPPPRLHDWQGRSPAGNSGGAAAGVRAVAVAEPHAAVADAARAGLGWLAGLGWAGPGLAETPHREGQNTWAMLLALLRLPPPPNGEAMFPRLCSLNSPRKKCLPLCGINPLWHPTASGSVVVFGGLGSLPPPPPPARPHRRLSRSQGVRSWGSSPSPLTVTSDPSPNTHHHAANPQRRQFTLSVSGAGSILLFGFVPPGPLPPLAPAGLWVGPQDGPWHREGIRQGPSWPSLDQGNTFFLKVGDQARGLACQEGSRAHASAQGFCSGVCITPPGRAGLLV